MHENTMEWAAMTYFWNRQSDIIKTVPEFSRIIEQFCLSYERALAVKGLLLSTRIGTIYHRYRLVIHR